MSKDKKIMITARKIKMAKIEGTIRLLIFSFAKNN